VVGVGLVNLVIFPEFLPFGFCGERFVKTREIRNSYSHAENNNCMTTLLNFATGSENLCNSVLVN
jgi:hypothetical protein